MRVITWRRIGISTTPLTSIIVGYIFITCDSNGAGARELEWRNRYLYGNLAGNLAGFITT